MSDHQTDLAERRAQLQRKAARQRAQLGAHVQAVEARFRSVDGGLRSARRLLGKPALLAGSAALLFFVGPLRTLGMLGRATLLISTARRLMGFARSYFGSDQRS